MKILVHSKVNEKVIESQLGLPEYSYYFAMREFLPCLAEIGEVVIIEDPKQEVDSLYVKARADGESCVFLSFTPPHTTLSDLQCPTVCVFAWEFSNIPDESWAGDERNNWSAVLEKLQYAITHSQFARTAVLNATSTMQAVDAIPSPVWDKFSKFGNAAPEEKPSCKLKASIDSRAMNFSQFDPINDAPNKSGEYYQYAVGLIEQRDTEIESLNTQKLYAETLVKERDELVGSANSKREYAEETVHERDRQIGELNSARDQVERTIQQRDEQLEQRNEQLTQRNQDCDYAESIVRERDEQLLQANAEREELEDRLRMVQSTLLGRLNSWLLRRKNN